MLLQALLLFNYENDNQNKANEEVDVNETKPENKQQRLIMKMEKCIINLDYKCFFKFCVNEHHFRDKRLLLDNVLRDMVKRNLLHVGHGNKAILKLGGCQQLILTRNIYRRSMIGSVFNTIYLSYMVFITMTM